jgi:hypothetical protein
MKIVAKLEVEPGIRWRDGAWVVAFFVTLFLASAGFASDIYQTTSPGSTDGWNGPVIWGGAAAGAGNNYFSATTYGSSPQANRLNYNYIYGRVRVVSGAAPFAGDALTIVPNTELLMKEESNGVATVNLILNGGLVRYSPSAGYLGTLAGTMAVTAASCVGVEHSVSNTTLTINSTLQGSGAISLRGGSTGTGLTVSFGGDLSGYNGKLVLGGGQSPLMLDFNQNYDLPNVGLVMGTAGTADKLRLDQNLKFASFTFGTNSLPTNTVYTAANLNALFGSGTQFIDGSGSLSVYGLPPPLFTITSVAVAFTNTLGLSVGVASNGTYVITSTDPAWTFAGSVGTLSSLATNSGTDNIGSYSEINLGYNATVGHLAGIRLYDGKPVVLFSDTALANGPNDLAFPRLATYPSSLYHISYGGGSALYGGIFGVYSFSTFDSDSPWLFFDTNYNSFVLSPATNYMIASDVLQSGSLSCGIDSAITQLPAGFTHRAVLVVQKGINRTYDTWGGALTSLAGKVCPANDTGVDLQKLGYWTDNKATYYYTYNSALGYAGTLLAIRDEFASNGVPLGYLQLDSWWYPKGANATWTNKNGGIYRFEADSSLFTNGLAGFQQQLGLPLVAHSRWIDTSSPYRSEYTMSADVCVDLRFWTNIMGYIKDGGVVTYEQDWLQQYSALMNLTDPPAYMNHMQSAAAANGINLQYCTPTARHYLQGSLYNNVTSIRVSYDGFTSARWDSFIYDSRLASAMGIWPFTDAYPSSAARCLLIGTLSGGPVGVGDALGTANYANLRMAVRPDSVIVKPDTSLVPLDQVYVSDAKGQSLPMVASTYTDHHGFRTAYVFAYARSSSFRSASFTPATLDIPGVAYVYDFFNHTGSLVTNGNVFNFTATINGDTSGGNYFVVAPVGPSGIGFVGDTNKFVTAGRQRIASLTDSGVVWAEVVFGQGETNVTLSGYAPSVPYAAVNGAPVAVSYDAAQHYFSVNVAPSGNGGNSLLALSTSPLPAVAALPPLHATMAGGNVQISWPASLTGYVIQKTSTLDPPVAWVTVTNGISLIGDQHVITVQPTEAMGFYRLRQ